MDHTLQLLINKLESLWPSGVWVVMIVLFISAAFHLAKQFQSLKTATISVKDKHFDQLSSLIQDKNISKKPGLLLEQAFERYFGFILSADEIHHLLESKKQLLGIRDLKSCRWMLEFKNSEYLYAGADTPKKKVKWSLAFYWIFAMSSILLVADFAIRRNWINLIMAIIFFVAAYMALLEIREARAAIRILNKEYGPAADSEHATQPS